VADARKQGRSSAEKSLAEKLDERFAALETRLAAPPVPTAPPKDGTGGAAAPRAPALKSHAETYGQAASTLVDLFSLNGEQLSMYTPKQLRAEFEKVINYGQEISGMPQRPRTPGRGGNK
jgi:hypothetical protein